MNLKRIILLMLIVSISVFISCGGNYFASASDNVAPEQAVTLKSGEAVVFSTFTYSQEGSVAMTIRKRNEHWYKDSQKYAILSIAQGSYLVVAYVKPGEYEIAGLQYAPGSGAFVYTDNNLRQENEPYSYFNVASSTCGWIGDYFIETHGKEFQLAQIDQEQSFEETLKKFKVQYPKLAAKCNMINSLTSSQKD